MKYQKPHHEYVKEQVEYKSVDKDLVWRLLGYVSAYKIFLILAVLVLIFSKIIEAAIPIFIGKISQTILDSFGLDGAERQAILIKTVKQCLVIFGLLLIGYFFDSINVVVKSWVGQKGLYRLRTQIYHHIVHMPLAYFDHHTVGRLMTRTIHDIDQINQMFAESVIPIFGNILLFISVFIGITIIDWRIAVLFIAILPLVWWQMHRFRYAQRVCYDRVRTVVAAMNTFVQEHLMGASTIRNFGLQAQERQNFEEINEDHCDAHIESIRPFAYFISMIDLLQNVSLIMAFALLVIYSPAGQGFEAGLFFTFSLYALMIFRPLLDLAERYNVLQSSMAAASRIFNVLDSPSEMAKDQGKFMLGPIESIAFEDVWFAYDNEHWVLKGISFALKKGESCALVGVTGEGKSTIMSLLLRFYEYQKGRILINNCDIREYSLNSLREQFSVVLQDPVIFSGTIEENIALFQHSPTIKKIDQVIDYLGMRALIEKFPKGLQYYLSERGRSLSIGEMQLISMARAVAHERSFLILDEATANIDTASEQVIQQALKKILSDRTTLVIAHRLSTIKDVTRILVLHEGRIVEEGSHQGLLKRGGLYEKLYRLQFLTGI